LLPPEDRIRLAEELLASLDPYVADVERARDLEILKRVAEVQQGLVALVPAKTAFAEVRSILRA
jgi:hypothetical protein